MTALRRIPGLLAALSVLACGGGGGGAGSPTAPEATKILSMTVIFNVMPIGGGIGGTDQAALLFDGREVHRRDWSILVGGCAGGCTLQATVEGVRSGSHTIAMKPLRQGFPTMRYTVGGAVVVIDTATGRQTAIDLPFRVVDLAVGQTVSFSVTV